MYHIPFYQNRGILQQLYTAPYTYHGHKVYRGNSSSVIVEATAEGTMYNGCHNDIRLSIDYRYIQILHVVKHTAVVTT